MLKEVIICITIVVAIVLGDFITQDYTKQSVTELSEKLEDLKEELMKEDRDFGVAKETNKKIKSEWEKRHDNLAYYIEHNELEKLESELKALESHIETSEYELSVEEIDESIFLLEHIQDRYAFNLENIF